MTTELLYLACPYSDPDPEVRRLRFELANHSAAHLIQRGYHVFSPISHSHPIAIVGDLPLGFDYWEAYDRRMLAACDRLVVLRSFGWEESQGVRLEMAIAEELGKPISFRDVGECGALDDPVPHRPGGHEL